MKTFILYLINEKGNIEEYKPFDNKHMVKTLSKDINGAISNFIRFNKDNDWSVTQIIDTSFDKEHYFKLLSEIEHKI